MILPDTAGCVWIVRVVVDCLSWAGVLAVAPQFPDPGMVIYYTWIAWLFVWVLLAFGRKRAEKRQPRGQRLLHVISMFAAAYLLYRDQPWFGALNRRFFPPAMWAAETGMWMTLFGAAFAIWARLHLGKNWSGEVTIREDHQLIRSGPYTSIRHPIYTGMLLALAGTALAIGEYRALLGFAVFAVGIVQKAKKEEAMLAQEFGASFEEHKTKTGFLLPKLG